jgi:IS1 family transposase
MDQSTLSSIIGIMKEDILRILKENVSDEGLKLKKLKKLVYKSLGHENDEEFDKTIEKLQVKAKIIVTDDDRVFVAASKQREKSSKKRKHDEALLEDHNENQSKQVDDTGIASEALTTSNATNLTKTAFYEDLWKNGEKYYREGAFTYEYNSKNPDG